MRFKLTAFVFILISVTLIACNKKDSGTTASASLPKTYTEDYSSPYGHFSQTFNLAYDAQGRPAAITSATIPSQRFSFDYATNVFHLNIYDGSTVEIHEDFFINSFSLVDSTFQYNSTRDTTTEKYFYNASRFLSQKKEYYIDYGQPYLDNTTNYTHDASGNILTETDDYTQTTYTYYPDLKYILPALLPYQYSGPNLVKKSTMVSGGETEVTDYTYTFDSNNRLTSAKEVNAVAQSTVTRSFTY